MDSRVARAFFFHFNKPASRRAKKPQWSVHFMDTCHIVDNVVFNNLVIKTRTRKTQPIGVLAGKCSPSKFRVEKGVAYLG